MRFKTFYLQEKEDKSFNQISNLTNIIAGCAGKNVEGQEKRENGLYFQVSTIGSWSIFKKKLIDALANWEDQSKDATNLKFIDGKISLFVKLEGTTAKFYFTKKKVKDPEWTLKDEEKETDSENEPSPKDDSEQSDASSDENENK